MASKQQMSALEEAAKAAWQRWGDGWAMAAKCTGCGEVKQCRGKRRARMVCLDCFDQGVR